MDPTVSVVIRTYNRVRYLGEAIQSVLAQTFRDLELIVVDDGSTDATPALLQQYGSRLTPILLDRMANRSALFNAGISAAHGELIAFLDDDDVWLPDKLEKQVALLGRHDRFGFAYGNVRLLYPDGRLSAPILTSEQIVNGSILRTIVRNQCVHPSTLIVRRRCFDRIGLFDEESPASETYLWYLRLAQATECVGVSEPVGLIRQHETQVSKTRDLAMYQAAITALEMLLRDRRLPAGTRLEAHRSLARHHFHLARKLTESGQLADARAHAARGLWRYPLHAPAWRWMLRSLVGQ